ncbi:recombinase family protein [Alicyclobacillus fastidiosus]|uniref:Recombinase family protein n=1 Tax=Alicyclobacillus fastidiosus TaxID=392011 RepID=A0ABV5A9B0_9BACL|nr:recombinase family protein [Alicyclobacillus fastidiosus]WEH10801.1 recombinase family protein [Alicyclobacillus fastidiosus]
MAVCAIYARVSDDSQVKGDSIDHQIRYCQEQARRRSLEEGEPWVIPESRIYVDEGITGTSMIKRPAVQRLIQDARANEFQVVLFKGISRFARDTVDALVMLRRLSACGVRVISMEENFDSRRDSAEFIFTIHSALAQAESEKTAIRVRVGASQKARSGKWNGRAPDGYVLNPQTKRLEIDEAVASVIRDIFSLYLSGMGVRKIADLLNCSGRLTKRGHLWTQRNLSRILKNPVYMGDVVYGRREKRVAYGDASDPLARNKRAVWVDDPARLVVCQNAHPAIVSREVFEEVQRVMKKRKTTSAPTNSPHLLTKGLLRCTCGGSMTLTYNGAGTAYYRCQRRRDLGRSACDCGHVRAQDLEREVLARVREDVLDTIQYDQLVIPKEQDEGIEARVRTLEAQLEKQIDKSQLLFDQYSDGRLIPEQYERINETIQQRIRALRDTMQQLVQESESQERGLDAEQYVGQAFRQFLQVGTTNARFAREILTIFVERVDVVSSRHGHTQVKIRYRFAPPL